MEYDELVDFLENKMSMSHIYQPLLIKFLVEVGGIATVRQLAHVFLSQDESQLIYYEDRLKQMPIPVLKRRGVVSKDGQLVSLNLKKMSFEKKAHIKMICEKKIQEYVRRRGLGIWDYRMIDKEPVPDSLYYRVLKDSGSRCALCGATKNERPLQVDHIIPRSRGGKTIYENLQVLCSKCNQAKSNKDDVDFRENLKPDLVLDCKFCYENIKHQKYEEFGSVVALKDGYPVTDGHLLIIPKKHRKDYFELSDTEKRDADQLMKMLINELTDKDPSVTGYNIGINCGASAGQTIFHLHYHLIPRRVGDTDDPRGGVRGVIQGKRSY